MFALKCEYLLCVSRFFLRHIREFLEEDHEVIERVALSILRNNITNNCEESLITAYIAKEASELTLLLYSLNKLLGLHVVLASLCNNSLSEIILGDLDTEFFC